MKQLIILKHLNSGSNESPTSSCPPIRFTASPMVQNHVEDEFLADDDVDDESLSSDEKWTPSVVGEDFNEEHNLDDNGFISQ